MENSNFAVACCVCHRIKESDNIWGDVDNVKYQAYIDSEKYAVSHGYCPPCLERARQEIMMDRGKDGS